MKIIFKKNNAKNFIHITRDDNTETWMQSDDFLIMHDLMHYATETTLKMNKGFYGIVNSGVDMNDFELPKEQRKFQMNDDALLAETLVNLLTIEYTQGRFENFNDTLEETRIKNNYNFNPFVLTEEQHNKIFETFELLITKWRQLNQNDVFELDFKS